MAWTKLRSRYHAVQGGRELGTRPWRTGVLQRAPITGVLALVTGLLCGLVTFVILKTSNGRPINTWRLRGIDVQPTVLLSIFATLANALLRYAFQEGVRVSWWTRALKGTSLGNLHRLWDQSQSVWAVAAAGRYISITAIANLFTILLLIDGPLLQRASTIRSESRQEIANLSVPISPTPFMRGATGILVDHDYEYHPSLYNPLFAKILQQYNNRQPITLPAFGCKGKCEMTVEAPGFDIDCESWTSPYRLMSELEYVWLVGGTNRTVPAVSQVMFSSNVTYSWQASDLWYQLRSYRTGQKAPEDGIGAFASNSILLSYMIKSTSGGNGTLTWRSCILREAMQRFPVTVQNATLTLKPLSLARNSTVYQVLRQTETAAMMDWPSSIGGFSLSLYNAFQGEANISTDGGWYAIRANNSSPLVYLDPITSAGALNSANVTWTDPIDDMISMLQELSLRVAIVTTTEAPPYPDIIGTKQEMKQLLTATQPYIISPNLATVNRTLSQTAVATMTYDEIVYQSNMSWLAGALALIILAFGTIVPIFNHWWRLGRTFTMSPIEIAKAFDAPLLRQTEDNCDAAELVTYVGPHRVRYGAMLERQNGGGQVQPARSVAAYGAGSEGETDKRSLQRQLRFDREDLVETPVQGETFASSRSINLSTSTVSRRSHGM